MAIEVSEIIKNITDDFKTIVSTEIELAKAELIPSGKTAGVGAGLLGSAGYLAVNAASLLFLAAGVGIGLLFNQKLGWSILGGLAIGFVIVAAILLPIAGILALIGKSKMKKITGPDSTKAEAAATISSVKDAITRTTAEIKGSSNANPEKIARRLVK
ncbi:MAG: phage holin family protein [Propionibacteriaceae bacterium]